MKLNYSFIFVFIFLILSVISQHSNVIHFDEKVFHLPTTKLFYEKGIFESINNKDYRSASTPLPYIIGALVHKVLGFEPTIKSLRFINYFVSFLTIILFILLLRFYNSNYIYAFILFFYPYFLKPSFAYFMSIYGLFFFFIFLFFFVKQSRSGKFFEGLFLTFAILSQQFYLIVIPFYYLYYLIENYDKNKIKEILIDLVFFSSPSILIILLFLSWGGMTHSDYRLHNIEFHIEYITIIILIFGGLFFLPILSLKLVENWKRLIVFFIISILLILFAYPKWSNIPSPGGISGYTFHAMHLAEKFNIHLALIIKIILTFLGLNTIYFLFEKSKNTPIFFILIAFLVGFLINSLPSERHMLPLIAITFLLLSRNFQNKFILPLWLVLQFILGSIYFYYIMFTYSNQV